MATISADSGRPFRSNVNVQSGTKDTTLELIATDALGTLIRVKNDETVPSLRILSSAMGDAALLVENVTAGLLTATTAHVTGDLTVDGTVVHQDEVDSELVTADDLVVNDTVVFKGSHAAEGVPGTYTATVLFQHAATGVSAIAFVSGVVEDLVKLQFDDTTSPASFVISRTGGAYFGLGDAGSILMDAGSGHTMDAALELVADGTVSIRSRSSGTSPIWVRNDTMIDGDLDVHHITARADRTYSLGSSADGFLTAFVETINARDQKLSLQTNSMAADAISFTSPLTCLEITPDVTQSRDLGASNRVWNALYAWYIHTQTVVPYNPTATLGTALLPFAGLYATNVTTGTVLTNVLNGSGDKIYLRTTNGGVDALTIESSATVQGDMVTRTIYPSTTLQYDLGTTMRRYSTVFTTDVDATGRIETAYIQGPAGSVLSVVAGDMVLHDAIKFQGCVTMVNDVYCLANLTALTLYSAKLTSPSGERLVIESGASAWTEDAITLNHFVTCTADLTVNGTLNCTTFEAAEEKLIVHSASPDPDGITLSGSASVTYDLSVGGDLTTTGTMWGPKVQSAAGQRLLLESGMPAGTVDAITLNHYTTCTADLAVGGNLNVTGTVTSALKWKMIHLSPRSFEMSGFTWDGDFGWYTYDAAGPTIQGSFMIPTEARTDPLGSIILGASIAKVNLTGGFSCWGELQLKWWLAHNGVAFVHPPLPHWETETAAWSILDNFTYTVVEFPAISYTGFDPSQIDTVLFELRMNVFSHSGDPAGGYGCLSFMTLKYQV